MKLERQPAHHEVLDEDSQLRDPVIREPPALPDPGRWRKARLVSKRLAQETAARLEQNERARVRASLLDHGARKHTVAGMGEMLPDEQRLWRLVRALRHFASQHIFPLIAACAAHVTAGPKSSGQVTSCGCRFGCSR